MIALVGVEKGFAGRTLFSDVNLTVGVQERIGLIGPNGSGKSTLLGILAGRVEPDSGEVTRNRRATVGMLEQEVPRSGRRTLLEEMIAGHERLHGLEHRIRLLEEEMRGTDDPEELERLALRHGELQLLFEQGGGYDLPAEAKRILSGLAFRESDFDRPVSEFSGGWLMRLALARHLLTEPDLLLLDEPTNYLDLESVIWLDGYLRGYPGSLLVVSHDRTLLNNLVRRILEIDGGKVNAYTGDYDTYRRARAVRDEGLEAARRAQDRRIAQTERFIARYRADKRAAARVQSRIKQLEKMERVETAARTKQIRLRFPESPRSGRVVIELRGMRKAYGSLVIYDDTDFRIERGERLVLVGPNGAGKSTLLKVLAGVEGIDAGERVLGSNVAVAYYAQHQVDTLRYDRTALEEVGEAAPGLTPQNVRSLLGRFLFTGDDVHKKISILSGGEKSRVALAKLLVDPPNLLLLDEPTSHLDIPSRDVLIEALKEYGGSLVMISHDRHFIERLADRVVEVGGGGVRDHMGGYRDYLRRKEERGGEAPALGPEDAEGAAEEGSGGRAREREQKRREAEARNERYRRLKPVREERDRIVAEIAGLEERISGLEARMADESFYRAGGASLEEAFKTHRELKAELEAKTERWEEVELRFEELEKEFGGGEEP
ncbi:MAG: ABC-F family ATP-binding cassette domain-containing protein [Candidatus Eisenbacteria bacterium]|nr:ABC-F family ATP-binding cassette domain-containing protein [Candidatus Eisenbacteria bacterium]